MMFEWIFLISIILSIAIGVWVVIKKYRIRYLYFIFQFCLIAMINLDGFQLENEVISSLDILFTGILAILFLISVIYFDTKFYVPFILYLLYLSNGVLSTFYSPVVGDSIRFLMRQIFFLLLMLLVMNYKMTQKKIDDLMVLWFKWSSVPSVIAIFQVLTNTGYRVKENLGGLRLTRAMGLASHPNFLAYYLMITLLVFFIVYSSRSLAIKRSTVMIIGAMDLFAFVFTFCRGAMIGLFVGSALYYFKKDIKKLLVLPILFGASVFIPGVGIKMMEMFNLSKLLTDSSFSWRLAYWGNIIGLMNSENIWMGNGLKSTIYYLNYPPHNEYIGFLFENGLIGVITFYTFLLVLIVQFRHWHKQALYEQKSYYLAGWILGIVSLIVAISDNYFMVPSSVFYFWFFNGLLLNIRFTLNASAASMPQLSKMAERRSV